MERFKIPQLLKFKDLFEPPLTVDRFNSARKELKRNGMLSKIEDIKRFVWKLSDTQINIMFEFFTSSQVIQNVAWGTIKGRISERMSCEESVFFCKSCIYLPYQTKSLNLSNYCNKKSHYFCKMNIYHQGEYLKMKTIFLDSSQLILSQPLRKRSVRKYNGNE